MANTFAQNMKNAIVTDLQSSYMRASLNCVIADDMTKVNPLDRDWPGFPAAVVIPPIVTDIRIRRHGHNLREYTWYIMVVTTPETFPDRSDLSCRTRWITCSSVFDLDCTLQGTAIGAVMPAVARTARPRELQFGDLRCFYLSFEGSRPRAGRSAIVIHRPQIS